MLDFSKPATATLNSYSSSSINTDKKDKKDKKEKKEKKDKKDKHSKDRDDDSDRGEENTNITNNNNQTSSSSSSSALVHNNNVQKPSQVATTPPILSSQSSNGFVGVGSNTFNSHAGTASFGFFGMQNQNVQNGGTGFLAPPLQQTQQQQHQNSKTFGNASSHNTSDENTSSATASARLAPPTTKSISTTATKSNGNKNHQNDDSDIEELDAGQGVVVGSAKNSNTTINTRKTNMNSTDAVSESGGAKPHHHPNQGGSSASSNQLSEAERVKRNQQAMQQQFAELGLSKAIRGNRDVSSSNSNIPNSNHVVSSSTNPYDDDDADDSINNNGTVLDSLNRIDVLAKMKSEDILEFVPRTLLLCNLIRQKGGFFDNNIYFQMRSEVGGHFILSARKRSFKTTTNFIISSSETSTSKSSEQFLGKVRGNASKTQYVVYDHGDKPENGYFDEVNTLQRHQNFTGSSSSSGLTQQQIEALGQSIANEAQLREELAYIMFAANVGGSGGARKMFVILPKPAAEFGHPVKKYRPRNDTETMKAHWKNDPSKFITLENKEATWNEALRAYQLNFNGRVTQQSVKNFQLVDSSNKKRVVLQVGKRGDDEFAVDFKAPLTAFMALCIALTAFDGSVTRE